MATVSIAIATYNGSRFLAEQLRSILAQTRLPDEIVLSDDKSTDGTVENARGILDRSGIPFLLITNPDSRGSTKNFENAISHCSGDIIFLCDQDDSWYPSKLELQSAILETDPALGYCFSNADLVDQSLNPIHKDLWSSLKLHRWIRRYENDQCGTLVLRPLLTGAASAFRRKPLLDAMPFDEGWVHDRWASIFCSAHGIPGKAISQSLFAYRQHPSQQLSALSDQTVVRKLIFIRSIDGSKCMLESKKWLRLRAALKARNVTEQVIQDVWLIARHLRVRAKIGNAPMCQRFRLAEIERVKGYYRYSSFPQSWLRDIFWGRQ